MTRLNSTSLKVAIISAVFLMGLAANPARADHYGNVVAPLATFVFLNSLFRHGHNHRHGYSRQRHGYNQQGYYQGYKRRGHSHSYGGYSHKQKRGYSRRNHGG